MSLKRRSNNPKKTPEVNSKEALSTSELRLRYRALRRQSAGLDKEIRHLTAQGVTKDLRPEMQALHAYNDAKDVTQMVLGYLSDAECCTVTELHKRANIHPKMSDTSEEPSERTDKDENACRDFIRGICGRKFCKYKHDNEIRPLNFCHDFQNNICPRINCKFIHCTPDEVEEYKRTGDMSNRILAEATRKNQLPGAPPICNQFKKGLCRRSLCKFRHVTREQEEQEILGLIQNNIQRKQSNVAAPEVHSIGVPVLRRSGASYDEYQDSGLPLAKRRFAAAEEMLNRELQLEADRNRPVFKGYFAGSPPPGVLGRVDATTLMLEEENNLLHKEIAQLKKQVQDLTATNEFLLDQNATLRVSSKQTTVTMPAVTLTSTNTQPQMIRTVTASVATVPVSLATVTTGNPVTGNPVSIAGCPTVCSIASPAQILAPSQQILVTTNPAQQLALATSTQHMANQQLALANASQQLNSQAQQLANQQLTSQAQQLALANTTQQLTSQAQQLALANTTQQLTSQAQQLALANAPQQLTSQAQQLALANTTQQLTVANVPAQQLTLANATPQLLAASTQQIELHRNAINTSQAIAMSHATQPMVSYPIMTQSLNHPMAH
ncbi:zinc finger CCCH domain-containing protein 10 isoform X3 [Dendroctonus ponderosae]